MFGDKQFTGVGYPTPVSIPEETTCLIMQVPANPEWWGLVVGVLLTLVYEENWQQFEGAITREEAAEEWLAMLDDALLTSEQTNTCATTVPTPYWDDSGDLDDEAETETQTWYGYVTDAEAAPSELTFVENALIWVFTGFLAIGVGDLALAVTFRTIAPRFVVAMRSNDFVEVIRVIIDGEEVARRETSGVEGDILNIDVVGDPEVGEHDLFLIRVPGA